MNTLLNIKNSHPLSVKLHSQGHTYTHYHYTSLLQAGLITPTAKKQLIIALEPEAASIYCRKLRMRECIPDRVPVLSVSPSASPSTGAPRYSLAGSHSTSKSSLNGTTAGGKACLQCTPCCNIAMQQGYVKCYSVCSCTSCLVILLNFKTMKIHAF